MSLKNKVVTVFGGTGFVGRYIVKRLAEEGALIKVVSRNPQKGLFLKTAADIGRIQLVYGDIRRQIEDLIEGSDIVINLVGILFEKGSQKFQTSHVISAENVAKECNRLKIPTLVHFSALGMSNSSDSMYAQTKLAGEEAVLKQFPDAIIIRPSLIYGPEDIFFNRFNCMAQLLPFLPLIGGGFTEFQPIYVDDVAHGVIKAIEAGKPEIYEFGGTQVYTFRQLMEIMLKVTQRKRYLVSVPFGLAKTISYISQLLPTPPLTPDQVILLKQNNVLSNIKPGLKTLGVQARDLEVTLPTYLRK